MLDVPLVPDDGEGDRQQRTGGGTLQHPGGDEDHEAVGEGRGRGAGGEDEEGALEHPHPAEPVGELAEQGHGCDVAEQVPGDDRRGPFQVVERDVEVPDDVDQDRDDDVGVERREQHRRAGGPSRKAP